MIRGVDIMLNEVNGYLLILTLSISTYYDIKEKRIPNAVTIPVSIWGLLSASINNGFTGFQFSLLGFLCGFVVFFIPFAFHLMGGGDVKLMAAIGALIGWKLILSVVLYSAIAGGILAIVFLVYNKNFIKIILLGIKIIFRPFIAWFQNKTRNTTSLKIIMYLDAIKIDWEKKYIPYAVAITIGTLIVVYLPLQ